MTKKMQKLLSFVLFGTVAVSSVHGFESSRGGQYSGTDIPQQYGDIMSMGGAGDGNYQDAKDFQHAGYQPMGARDQLPVDQSDLKAIYDMMRSGNYYGTGGDQDSQSKSAQAMGNQDFGYGGNYDMNDIGNQGMGMRGQYFSTPDASAGFKDYSNNMKRGFPMIGAAGGDQGIFGGLGDNSWMAWPQQEPYYKHMQYPKARIQNDYGDLNQDIGRMGRGDMMDQGERMGGDEFQRPDYMIRHIRKIRGPGRRRWRRHGRRRIHHGGRRWGPRDTRGRFHKMEYPGIMEQIPDMKQQDDIKPFDTNQKLGKWDNIKMGDYGDQSELSEGFKGHTMMPKMPKKAYTSDLPKMDVMPDQTAQDNTKQSDMTYDQ